eukprot:1080990-Lingulodinium_polyedra.AAC.1
MFACAVFVASAQVFPGACDLEVLVFGVTGRASGRAGVRAGAGGWVFPLFLGGQCICAARGDRRAPLFRRG